MADVVCVVRGYRDVNVEMLIGTMLLWELGGYSLLWQMWCVWSGDTEM